MDTLPLAAIALIWQAFATSTASAAQAEAAPPVDEHQNLSRLDDADGYLADRAIALADSRTLQQQMTEAASFPLALRLAPDANTFSATNADALAVKALVEKAAKPQNLTPIAMVRVGDVDPCTAGETLQLPGRETGYVLPISLEEAEFAVVEIVLGERAADDTVAAAYTLDAGGAVAELVGPIALTPRASGRIRLPIIRANDFFLEIRRPHKTRARNCRLGGVKAIGIYYGLDASFLKRPEPFESSRPKILDCAHTNVNCVSNLGSVDDGVVRVMRIFGLAGSSCTGWFLRDAEGTTDIPYVVTAGHCDADEYDIYVWDEYPCGGTSRDSRYQLVNAPVFELALERPPVSTCPDVPDWMLLRFNLLASVTSGTPLLLDAKTSTEPFADAVRVVHHPDGSYKRLSTGDLSGHGTYHRYYDLNNGNYTEGGSSGSPVFDVDDNRVVGIHVCGPGTDGDGSQCNSVDNRTMTKWSYVATQLTRFLSPSLASPSTQLDSPPASITLGNTFSITLRGTNNGSFTSPDGHFHLALPDFAASGDEGRVSITAKSSDLTCIEFSAGYSGLNRRDGTIDSSAAYVHVECWDTAWSAGEENFITVSVTPKAAGGFRFRYRAAMRSQNSYYYNHPATSGFIDSDQQWLLHEHVVTVSQASPDLVVISPSANGSSFTAAQTFTVSATVHNQGSGTAAASTLGYYYSSNATITTSDVTFGSPDSIPSLSSGAGSPQSTQGAIPTAGTWWVGACVAAVTNDPPGNNCSTGVQVTVTQATTPDLIVINPSASGTSFAPGQSFTVTATAHNQGSGPASASTLEYYYSTNVTISTSDTSFGTSDAIPGLASGASSPQSTQASIPTSGTWWLGACVAAVANDPPSNNCSAGVQVTVTQPTTPDLIVINPATSGSSFLPGQLFTFSATVRNQGAGTAGASTLLYFYSSDSTIGTGDPSFGSADSIVSLTPGEGSPQSTQGAIPNPGTWWVGACVTAVSNDPPANNCSVGTVVSITAQSSIFSDGFESGSTARWQGSVPAGCADDVFEDLGANGSDDACFGAPIGVGESQAHAHCDQDWIWFGGTAGRTYRVETFSLTSGADTVIAVFEDCGANVGGDDDGGGEPFSSSLEFIAPSSGAYDVRIEELGGQYSAGEGYTVRVTCIANC